MVGQVEELDSRDRVRRRAHGIEGRTEESYTELVLTGELEMMLRHNGEGPVGTNWRRIQGC